MNLDELIDKTPDGAIRTALIELKARAEAAERERDAAQAENERVRAINIDLNRALCGCSSCRAALDVERQSRDAELDAAHAEIERLRAELARATVPAKPWYD